MIGHSIFAPMRLCVEKAMSPTKLRCDHAFAEFRGLRLQQTEPALRERVGDQLTFLVVVFAIAPAIADSDGVSRQIELISSLSIRTFEPGLSGRELQPSVDADFLVL